MKEDPIQQFSKRIVELRREHDLTQEQVAKRSGISLKYIQRIEGKNPPNIGLESLCKISKAFKIPLWKLLRFK